ncbi:MAG: hypothetical protein K6E63_06620 [Lachnospiraceae bacterium]|nr:hypothetical protein [Lachnospiraceae bacterium]
MFNKSEIAEIEEAAVKFPWIGSYKVSSEFVSIADKASTRHWRIIDSSKSSISKFYTIQQELKGFGFVNCNAGSTIAEALSKLNERLTVTGNTV